MKNYNSTKNLIKSILEEINQICINGHLNVIERLENQARINYEKYKTLMKIIELNNIKIPKKIQNNIINFIIYFE